MQRHYQLNVKQTAISGVYYMACCTFLMNMCVQAAILAYGAHLLAIDLTSADTLLAFMLYQGQLQEYFGNLLNSFTNLIKSAGAGAKVFAHSRRAYMHIYTYIYMYALTNLIKSAGAGAKVLELLRRRRIY